MISHSHRGNRVQLKIESLEFRCLLSYTITDLGVLGAGEYSIAYGMNSKGQVVGQSDTGGGIDQAFLYARRMKGLCPATECFESRATAINDATKIVGVAEFQSEPGKDRAFVWQGGVITPLPEPPGSTRTWPTAINNDGHIAGYYDFALNGTHALLWQDGTFYDLGTLGGSESIATGINGPGQIVGFSNVVAGPNHAFIWDGVMTDLGTLGTGESSYATAINSDGLVVGAATVAGSSELHGFGWQNGQMFGLGQFNGKSTYPTSVTSYGLIVGFAGNTSAEYRAIIMGDAGWHDLNNFLPPDSLWVLQDARDINDAGQIVGTGFNPSGERHAFRLTPTGSPSPSSGVHRMPDVLITASLEGAAEPLIHDPVHPWTPVVSPEDAVLEGAAPVGRVQTPAHARIQSAKSSLETILDKVLMLDLSL